LHFNGAWLLSGAPMESETFRSRLAQLVQKSRKAIRLYTSMGKLGPDRGEFAEVQVGQWREVNSELLRALSELLDNPNQRALAGQVFALRDRFCAEWRRVEADLRVKQQELISAAERSDFVRAAHLSRELVLLKAREQATQAAHHELEEVLKKSRLSQPTIELPPEAALPAAPGIGDAEGDAEAQVAVNQTRRSAKIIPLRS